VSDIVTEHRHEFSLGAAHTALLVIDMQYASACRDTGLGKLLAQTGRAEEGEYRFSRIEQHVVPNIQRLLAACRATGIPPVFVCLGARRADFADLVVHLRDLERAIGNWVGSRTFEILDELKPLDGEAVVVKGSYSAFTSSGLDAVLRSVGVGTIIAAGVSTSQCVDLTMRDAADRGYRCVVVEDAVAEDTEADHLSSLDQFARSFGKVLDTATVVELLTVRAGHSR
jgi:nicotinamidase-related amidase